MPRHRSHLPQLDGRLFLTDGGLETDLIFHHGVDLPEFAAYPLVASEAGRALLEAYYRPYLATAAAVGAGFVLEAPTWRAGAGWGARLGDDPDTVAERNRQAVAAMVALRDASGRPGDVVVSGCVGPQGDAYAPQAIHPASAYHRHHDHQVGVLAATEVDLVTAMTMTHVEEAVGVVRAAVDHGVPVAVSFTVETDGRLPSGVPLVEALAATDAATGGAPAYYMVNCAHPTHFLHVLDPDEPVLRRLRGVRANSSTCSHAELDEATELDEGDPDDLARCYVALRRRLPGLDVLGGCCGTDHRHVAAIAAAVAGGARSTPVPAG